EMTIVDVFGLLLHPEGDGVVTLLPLLPHAYASAVSTADAKHHAIRFTTPVRFPPIRPFLPFARFRRSVRHSNRTVSRALRYIVCVGTRNMNAGTSAFRAARFAAAVTVLAGWAACAPHLPPTEAPASPDPTFDPLRASLQAYVDRTQPYRKEAAQAQESAPGKGQPTPAA